MRAMLGHQQAGGSGSGQQGGVGMGLAMGAGIDAARVVDNIQE